MEQLARLVVGGSAAARAGVSLGAELIRIGLGRSELAPQRGDARFRDPAWSENLSFRRLLQTYLAWCRSIDVLVDSQEEDDWRRAAKARFLLGILTSAAAPTNVLAGNPAALKRLDTGGTSLVRGARNWAADLPTNGGMPSMVKQGAMKVGEDLAVTPGGVVSRDAVAELIQYSSTTEEVYERPVLVVPPPIGRYYFLDLAPNPPGNPRATYFTGSADARQSADDWLSGAEQRSGSWWELWADWTVARSGPLVVGPRTLGDASHPVLVPAPGAYVRDEVPA